MLLKKYKNRHIEYRVLSVLIDFDESENKGKTKPNSKNKKKRLNSILLKMSIK